MRRVSSLLLILIGSGVWWTLARTNRFSVRRWDAKYEGVLRQALSESGLTDQNLESVVHEVKTDADGDWVFSRRTFRKPGLSAANHLKESLESAGARVETRKAGADEVMTVWRGSRLYEEIRWQGSGTP